MEITRSESENKGQLRFHPLADMFPLMEGAEFDALVADIKANKLRDKIVLYDGMVLDGRNRFRALRALGLPHEEIHDHYCVTKECIDKHHGGPAAYVISANIHRRHLTAEQKAEVLAKLVAAQPKKSDRELAKQARVSHPTIAKARRKAEATGKALPVDKRVGADGKARKQPAKKPAKHQPRDVTVISASANAEPVAEALLAVEEAQKHNETLAEKLRAAEIKIAGLESEVEELRAENAKLRRALEDAPASDPRDCGPMPESLRRRAA
jgi:hypothetical protein